MRWNLWKVTDGQNDRGLRFDSNDAIGKVRHMNFIANTAKATGVGKRMGGLGVGGSDGSEINTFNAIDCHSVCFVLKYNDDFECEFIKMNSNKVARSISFLQCSKRDLSHCVFAMKCS